MVDGRVKRGGRGGIFLSETDSVSLRHTRFLSSPFYHHISTSLKEGSLDGGVSRNPKVHMAKRFQK